MQTFLNKNSAALFPLHVLITTKKIMKPETL